MRKLLQTLLDHLPAVLVTVTAAHGSVPRGPGAHMAVNAGGRLCGTVGGGALEAKAIRTAQAVQQSGEPLCQLETLTPEGAVGMVCGGSAELLYQPLTERDRPTLAAALAACEAGTPMWFAFDRVSGALSLLDSPACPSAETVYSEPLFPAGIVYIFGGGHVAQALVPVLAAADFRCVVLDDRPEFCDPALFPGAWKVRQVDFDALDLDVHAEDFLCIMTRGHGADLACEDFALRTQAKYIGVMGSRRKTETLNARLRERGFDERDLARVSTPIGLDIGAQTPAEIAVSVAAQLIAVRAGRNQR